MNDNAEKMNNVNKTLFIPLYGKALVSRKGIILTDKKAERIWEAEGFPLKGKSRSKWLAYYMAMRAEVFDRWLADALEADKNAVVLHIGCGMDSRSERVGDRGHKWYDIDFPEVIGLRARYFTETENYRMLAGDARNAGTLFGIAERESAVVVFEGISMYLTTDELKRFLRALSGQLGSLRILMDCYTGRGAKATRYKNPINDVGVTTTYGIDDPAVLEDDTGVSFVKEHDMTPPELTNELTGAEKAVFRRLFGGKFSKSIYRMYEFKK